MKDARNFRDQADELVASNRFDSLLTYSVERTIKALAAAHAQGRAEGAEAMRETATEVVDAWTHSSSCGIGGHPCEHKRMAFEIATRIRALPLPGAVELKG